MDEVPNAMSMRVIGGIVLLASIIQVSSNLHPQLRHTIQSLMIENAQLLFYILQIGVAGGAYNMTSWNVGSWWAGLLCFITGIFAVISNNKYVEVFDPTLFISIYLFFRAFIYS